MADNHTHRLAGRYEVRSMIGRGGMAQVHLGFDTRLSRVVAIKMLRTDLARDSIFQTRFRREAQAAASLNHPNIVAVYDTGEEDVTTPDGSTVSVPYIVMEYVEGHTVRDLLAGGAPVPIDEAVEIISGVLSALEYSHVHGLVHRDIKPGNIMLTNTGKIKVMDFGIARALTDSQATMTQTNAVVGTAQYLSPEQAHGDPVDARSDIYSTGCVLFELLTGQPPFKGDSAVAVAYQHVSEIPPKPSSITSDVPDSIDRVVLKALAKNRDDRYSSAEEMRADLNRAARGALVMAPETDSWQAPATQVMSPATMTMPAATMPPPAPAYDTQTMARIDTLEEEPKKKRWPIALLIVVALAMIGGLVWWFATNSAEPEVEQVPVPTVVGQTQEQAIATLKEAGLEFAIASTEASSEIPANSVISSDPEAGTIVDKGTTVKVVLSSGPADTTVPDVSGLTQQQARDQLKQNGLQVSDVVTVDDPSQEKGRVIKTDPEAGAKISEGESVKLFIASGNVSVPADLVGRPRDEVLQALQELGLNTNVETEESADHAEGTVMSLSATGTVSKDTTITVTVAKAPAPTQPPAQEQPQPPAEQPSENGE
ncbi:Stk1 family PASTA domain-containing Ser/Thr kinase [Actinomyces sp. HMSC075B09]|uniref:Stk1 family PASTA domain-containing Ser/Thr kinase n=1 Tax=Actinomyces sp. HMSC075B09 TaxID=1739358 RepID=UPI0008A1470F|nr:Stk1 family PASTA domain-containing Ser/Thr kinase [Actinomyces sp. HMSC075B09]OFJ62861.1 serine/threonine protein kinase [Actinomyces sp. HMSC075B09]